MATEAEQANIAVIRRIMDLLNADDVDAASMLLAEDVVDHNPTAPAPGRKGFQILHGLIMRSAFTNWRAEHEQIVASGDMVVTLVRMHGMNTGPFMGIPPTNAEVSATGMEMYRLADGLVVEHWAQFDLMTLLRQLGAIVAVPVGPPGPPGGGPPGGGPPGGGPPGGGPPGGGPPA